MSASALFPFPGSEVVGASVRISLFCGGDQAGRGGTTARAPGGAAKREVTGGALVAQAPSLTLPHKGEGDLIVVYLIDYERSWMDCRYCCCRACVF